MAGQVPKDGTAGGKIVPTLGKRIPLSPKIFPIRRFPRRFPRWFPLGAKRWQRSCRGNRSRRRGAAKDRIEGNIGPKLVAPSHVCGPAKDRTEGNIGHGQGDWQPGREQRAAQKQQCERILPGVSALVSGICLSSRWGCELQAATEIVRPPALPVFKAAPESTL